MFNRTLKAVAATGVVASAAGVAVVASSYALYSLLSLSLPAAAAAAVVAALYALIAIVVALWVSRGPDRAEKDADGAGLDPGLIPKIVEMAGGRPLVAAGLTAAAAVLAWKNPALVAALVKAFIGPQTPEEPPARGRKRKA